MLQRILVPVRKRLVRAFPSKSTRRHGMVGPAHVWKMKRAFQIRFLTDQGLKPEHYFLDLGCGTLRGGIPLIEYLEPGHYFGLEINADRLAEGRKEVRELGLEEKRPILVQHIGEIDRKFDYVWAFSVLIHMTDEVLDETLGFVGNHLSGAFYANVNIGERHQGRWAEFPVVWRSFDFYRDACASHGLTVADLGPISLLGHASKRPLSEQQRVLRITPSAFAD